MHNIENKCKNFKNEGIFIFFAKSSLQNMIDSSVSMDCNALHYIKFFSQNPKKRL